MLNIKMDIFSWTREQVSRKIILFYFYFIFNFILNFFVAALMANGNCSRLPQSCRINHPVMNGPNNNEIRDSEKLV